ncbi:unnamed protein product [Notodromas monacha]|uniref:glutathione transferase n=1 Tax=Notodromas monacha TaxID=399045 RepID=A0A7R9BUE9_9CRUS|nr:unnamed protein product [Notodromas monacha]CAG0921968.1 unnamed protein product [Notodromas monacha]
MHVTNMLLMAPKSSSDSSCEILQFCYSCQEGGGNMLKRINLNEFEEINSVKKFVNTDFKGNLNRKLLQTTATNSYRTFYPTGKYGSKGEILYTGFDVDILDIIANSMNFTYVWRTPEPPATWGSQMPNGSWNGIVGRIVKKELDISVTVMSMLETRNLVIDYAFPYDYDGMHLMEAAPIPLTPGFRAIINPFGSITWLIFAFSAIVAWAAIYVSLKLSAIFSIEAETWVRKEDFGEVLALHVFNSIVRQHSDRSLDATIPTHNTRIILGIWSLLVMILTTYYLTVQFAMFFNVQYTPVMDTGEDYINVPKTIVSLGSSTGEALFKSWGISNRAIFTTPATMANVYLDQTLKNRNMVLGIWRNVIRNWLFNFPSQYTDQINPKHYRISRGYPMPFYTAVALQKMSPYTEFVSVICMRLQEAGIVAHLNDHYAVIAGKFEATFAEMSYDPVVRGRKERPLLPLSLVGHLSGAFALLWGGLFIASAKLFVFEKREKISMSYRYTLFYFDGPGRAEIPRLLFAQAGVNFDDRRIPFEKWPEMKKTFTFEQVPVLREYDQTLAQSNAIARFLAEKFGLAGRDTWEKALCDSIVDTARDVWDLHRAWRLSTDMDTKNERKQALIDTQLPNFFASVDKFLAGNPKKSGWLVGDELTWADIYIAHSVEKLSLETPPVSAKDYPDVIAHMERVKAQPRIKAYEEKRGDLKNLMQSPHKPLPPN